MVASFPLVLKRPNSPWANVKLYKSPNKLDCLLLTSLSSLVYYMWVRPRAQPIVELLSCALVWYAPGFLANIRLGWKGLSGTNTPAYYDHFINYSHKKFITLAPDLT
jgi:hypothetical protein